MASSPTDITTHVVNVFTEWQVGPIGHAYDAQTAG